MARVYNFGAGPATMPVPVLERIQSELLDYHGQGLSILEMSHRTPAFTRVIQDAEACLRRLMGIPDTYAVLFLQGGATLQFAGIPMNLMRTGRAGYLRSGLFSTLAWQEAQKHGEALVVASSEGTGYDRVPDPASYEVPQDLDYLYICENNTIYGTKFWELPRAGAVPLVSDVSSCFLSEPVDVSRYGLIYAGVQKNAGPAGLSCVIVRRDLMANGPAKPYCPGYLDYRLQDQKDSMMNTPNTFAIYACGLVFQWIEDQGGLEAMRARNRAKAELMYAALDRSRLFCPHAQRASRSLMNATFRTGSKELDEEFIAGAEARGMIGVRAHRSTGGMRASMYNALPIEAVQALVAYMEEFEAAHPAEAEAAAERAGHEGPAPAPTGKCAGRSCATRSDAARG